MGLYRRFGYDRLLVPATVESDGDLLGAIGDDEHLVVRLEAKPATLRRRSIEREPRAGPARPTRRRLSTTEPLSAGLDGVALALSR